MPKETKKPLEITAITPSDLAAVLSNSFRRKVTEEQVLDIAEAGNLLAAEGTINLIHYTEYLPGDPHVGRLPPEGNDFNFTDEVNGMKVMCQKWGGGSSDSYRYWKAYNSITGEPHKPARA